METEKTETMEEMIAASERKGWRISNLSFVAATRQYSCILERKKVGDDGFPVYAMGALSPTPSEALRSAWGHAQSPIGNSRVVARRGAKPAAVQADPALDALLSGSLGHRLRLEDAIRENLAARAGEGDVADDDAWTI